MIDAIETRELITLTGLDAIVRATYHKARNEDPGAEKDLADRNRVGVLFLSSLSPTRAATGDSAVYWADALAQSGYPSFRLDLPGFGDSGGDPPAGLLEFIDSGGYAPIASAKAREIVERFRLSGIILVGLCSGAVSAIYTAATTRECKGLILMDPYFHLPLKSRSKIWQKLTGRFSRSVVGMGMGNLLDRLRTRWLRLIGNPPPGNANFALLNCWKDVATTGLPIILFKAPGFKQRGEFDYLSHILKVAGSKSEVAVKVIEGAGHTFSSRAGRTAVRDHVENWLIANFPLPVLKETAEGTSSSRSQDVKSDHSSQDLYLQNRLVLKGR